MTPVVNVPGHDLRVSGGQFSVGVVEQWYPSGAEGRCFQAGLDNRDRLQISKQEDERKVGLEISIHFREKGDPCWTRRREKKCCGR